MLIQKYNEGKEYIGKLKRAEVEPFFFDVEEIAGENISVYSVVERRADGKVYKASSANIHDAGKAIGIALQSANINDSLRIRTRGRINMPDLTAETTYFLSNLAGSITATQPSTGYLQIVGTSASEEILEIQLFLPIIIRD